MGTCEGTPRTAVSTQTGPVYPMPISGGEVDGRLIPGMRANVQVDVPPLQNVLLVPAGALNGGAVWVGDKKRPVMTGRSDGKSTEIVSGLIEGEEVLTQGKP